MDIFKIKDRDKTLVQIDKEVTRRKIENFKNTVIDGAKMAVEWSIDHPVEAIGVLAMCGSALYKGGRLITKNRQIKHDQFITDCRMYDRKYDEYVCSKRKLTNDEALYVQRMYDKGQSKRQSLIDLGLIK